MNHLSWLAIPFLLLCPQGLHGQKISDLQKQVRQELKGKVLVLRIASRTDKLTFDPDGHPIGTPLPGAPAMDSGFRAEKVNLDKGSLTLQGPRLVEVYAGGLWKVATARETLHISIGRAQGQSMDGLFRALSQVLLRTGEAFPATPPPDPGRPKNSDLESSPENPPKFRKKGTSEWLPPSEIDTPIELGTLENGEPVYLSSKVVMHPVAVSTPDPEYPANQRMASDSGKATLRVVVDGNGFVHTVAVVGGEADFQAAALGVLRKWRFRPATLHGNPVACEINVEFNFHIG